MGSGATNYLSVVRSSRTLNSRNAVETQGEWSGELVDTQAPHVRVWERMRPLLRRAVDSIGVKATAAATGMSDAGLLHAVEGRERHEVKGPLLVYLLQTAAGVEALRVLAEACGFDLLALRRLTAEEERDRLLEAIHDLVPGAEAGILDKAGVRKPPRRAP